MKSIYKLAILLLIVILALAGVLNFPLVPRGKQTICDHANCSSHEVYGSVMQVYFPCSIFSCIGGSNVKTITMVYAMLSSGSASTLESRGTANLTIAFNNPDQGTNISSISFRTPTNASLTVYQCSSKTSCSVLDSTFLTIATGRITSFNTTGTAFYFASPIVNGQNYSYLVSFTDGQSISGALVAK